MSETLSELPLPPSRRCWTGLVMAFAIVLVGIIAYSNSLRGQFVLDDERNIQTNTPLRTLWPTRASLLGPPWTTLTGRPLVMLTFAAGYRLHHLEPYGYHVENLLIHLAGALVLFGILRRTLQLPALAPTYQGRAVWLAGAVALIWVCHPLNTSSVTYISQRAESLMGLFYLLTIYSFIRAATGSRIWYAVSVLACLAGLATKEPMASAPVFVLLYDRTLIAGSFSNAIRQRRIFYALLGATLLPFAALLSMHRMARTSG